MVKTCLVFVYGLLQPGYKPPRSMKRHWPDAVRGRLFDLGPYPGIVSVGTGEGWIHGHVVEIEEWELESLDRFEDVAGGLYRRQRVLTREQRDAWIYEFARMIPAGAREIDRWPA
jgi:gamma-glutamylcyclotransferase (GGCT)/AIG2-like uncharacterized protein YtfP